jgi:hypothetical protein
MIRAQYHSGSFDSRFTSPFDDQLMRCARAPGCRTSRLVIADQAILSVNGYDVLAAMTSLFEDAAAQIP